MAKYIFRLDDLCSAMDWAKFERLRKIFSTYGVKPIVAVVPDNKDIKLIKGEERGDFWEIIKKLKNEGWAVAMHGYQHNYTQENGGILKIHTKSEFAGLPYEEQLEKIRKGKEILKEKGIETDIFIAPGHSFDENTLKALKISGFNAISDGIALFPFKKFEIIWIPQIAWGPRKFLLGLITFCLHPNTMEEKDFQIVEEFIKNNKTNNFSTFTEEFKKASFAKKIRWQIVNFFAKLIWRLKNYEKRIIKILNMS